LLNPVSVYHELAAPRTGSSAATSRRATDSVLARRLIVPSAVAGGFPRGAVLT
jgi:hypothetical protein